jgi:hypothetical protein
MVTQIAGLFEAPVLSTIAVLHLYWVLGGRWGAAIAVPTLEHDAARVVLSPPITATRGVFKRLSCQNSSHVRESTCQHRY